MTRTPSPTSAAAQAVPRLTAGAAVAPADAPVLSTHALDPGERGTTTLADKVIEKIAARAAVDVTHALGLSRRLAGRDFGTPTVRAQARVDGQVAYLSLALAVEYPASARATTREVRAHVSNRVATLCGLDVDHIDITVAVLRRPNADRRRVQ